MLVAAGVAGAVPVAALCRAPPSRANSAAPAAMPADKPKSAPPLFGQTKVAPPAAPGQGLWRSVSANNRGLRIGVAMEQHRRDGRAVTGMVEFADRVQHAHGGLPVFEDGQSGDGRGHVVSLGLKRGRWP